MTPGETGYPTYGVSILAQFCRLSIIADRILNDIYAEGRRQSRAGDPDDLLQRLTEELDLWQAALPEHLLIRFDDSGVPDVRSDCRALPHALSLL